MGDHASTPSITVRGIATIRTEPDEASLVLTLNALEDTPGAALSEVAVRSNALAALLDELGVGKSDRTTTGITVEEEWDHTDKGRRSLGHRAVSRLSVRLADPELIGRLVTKATTDLAAVVNGPHWVISLDNPVRLEAARLAAADARRRAEAYAEGIGATLGRLIGLREPGTREPAMATTSMRAMAGHGSMHVELGEHEIAAGVDATFALELD
jgi:uncharacterized protein YggE